MHVKVKVDLPSGGWVEVRDKLKAADKFAVQDAVVFTFESGGSQQISAGLQNKMRNALLSKIITGWSYELPIPSQNEKWATEDLGDIMDIDDYNALQQAVEPLFEKVSFSPNR